MSVLSQANRTVQGVEDQRASAAEVLIADICDSRFNATVERLPANVVVRRCVDLPELETALAAERAAVVVIGKLGSGLEESLTAAYQVREQHPSARVVFVTDFSSEALVLGALRAGVAEYLNAPLTGLEIAEAVTRFLPSDIASDPCSELVGTSPQMREVKAMIGRIAGMNSTVLITGETGTGKEVAARLIHRLSARSGKALVCVNCAAIPDALLESELFGYEKGAFTGAGARHPGQLKLADGGTLFLDEIGDMSAPAQAKILRAIEQHEVSPLGGSKPIPVDFRTIAATHHDLERSVDEGKFRSDLFFRLHVASLRLPPLRERREDIPALARHILREINRQHGLAIEDFTPSAMRRLTHCDWPGNVRQLRNAIEAGALMCDSRLISEANLRTLHGLVSSRTISLRTFGSIPSSLTKTTEPEKLRQTLEETKWNVTRTAELLSWSRMTVYRKVAKYQLERKDNTVLAG
jgi:DNA-binding NtrC family response regulator